MTFRDSGRARLCRRTRCSARNPDTKFRAPAILTKKHSKMSRENYQLLECVLEMTQSPRIKLGQWPPAQLRPGGAADYPLGLRRVELQHHQPPAVDRPHVQFVVVHPDLAAA